MPRTNFSTKSLKNKLGALFMGGSKPVEEHVSEVDPSAHMLRERMGVMHRRLHDSASPSLRMPTSPDIVVDSESAIRYLCRRRSILDDNKPPDGKPRYSAWGAWLPISRDEYMRDYLKSEHSGLRQYKVAR
jgi:hypothetical protein